MEVSVHGDKQVLVSFRWSTYGKATWDMHILIFFKIIFIGHVSWSLPKRIHWPLLGNTFTSLLYIKKVTPFLFSGFLVLLVHATTDRQLILGVTFLELGKWGEGSNAGMKLAYENSCAHFKKFDIYKYKITQQIK